MFIIAAYKFSFINLLLLFCILYYYYFVFFSIVPHPRTMVWFHIPLPRKIVVFVIFEIISQSWNSFQDDLWVQVEQIARSSLHISSSYTLMAGRTSLVSQQKRYCSTELEPILK